MTKRIPYYEFEPGVFEIDEFDCASIFVIVGTERALVLDTGVGIGDLRWVIENRITSKPYDVVITHNHADHVGGATSFDSIWIHEKDQDFHGPLSGANLEFRKNYAHLIATRENKYYSYDPEQDIVAWKREPVKKILRDGQVFDLGSRKVTIYHCPGHTAGECVAIDDKSRILFLGDACNRNLLLEKPEDTTVREAAGNAYAALARIQAMSNQYDTIYNFHHDFRGIGSPLRNEVLADAVTCLKNLSEGKARYTEVPDSLSENGETKIVAEYGTVQVSCMNGNIKE